MIEDRMIGKGIFTAYHRRKQSKFGEMDHQKTPNGGPKMPVSALSADSMINTAFFLRLFLKYV